MLFSLLYFLFDGTMVRSIGEPYLATRETTCSNRESFILVLFFSYHSVPSSEYMVYSPTWLVWIILEFSDCCRRSIQGWAPDMIHPEAVVIQSTRKKENKNQVSRSVGRSQLPGSFHLHTCKLTFDLERVIRVQHTIEDNNKNPNGIEMKKNPEQPVSHTHTQTR